MLSRDSHRPQASTPPQPLAVAGGLNAEFVATLHEACRAWHAGARVHEVESPEQMLDSLVSLGHQASVTLVLSGRWFERAGLELLAEARRVAAGAVTLAVDARVSSLAIGHGLRYGLRGLVSSTVAPQRLAEALAALAAGELWISRRQLAEAVALMVPERDEPAEDVWLRLPTLTEREKSVLLEVLDGKPNKLIARRLGISEQTVKIHLVHVYRKLGVCGRSELIKAVAHAPASAGPQNLALA